MNHKCDTDERVCFYEQEFYMLSNFSAFEVRIYNHAFKTSEHAYQWSKFVGTQWAGIQNQIEGATSAHDAFKLAEASAAYRRKDWDQQKAWIMTDILSAKVEQHEYVRRKLLETGDRKLIEDSWRDDFWGWGPNGNGQNMLGRIWMQIRVKLRSSDEDRER